MASLLRQKQRHARLLGKRKKKNVSPCQEELVITHLVNLFPRISSAPCKKLAAALSSVVCVHVYEQPRYEFHLRYTPSWQQGALFMTRVCLGAVDRAMNNFISCTMQVCPSLKMLLPLGGIRRLLI